MPQKDESKFSIKVPKFTVAKKTYDFSLSLPGMISAVGAGVLALTFFFVMGILIGRGYRPEADVPQLEEIMPTKQHGQMGEGQPEAEILKPEELGYADRLKEEPESVIEPQEEAPKATEAAKPQTAAPAPQPEAAQPTAMKQAEVQPAPAMPGEATFDYVYQVASFRKQEMAQSLSDKLAAGGLAPYIQAGEANGSTWYRVYVKHRGTPTSTDSMKATLAKFGIDKPLLKKKTPLQ